MVEVEGLQIRKRIKNKETSLNLTNLLSYYTTLQ